MSEKNVFDGGEQQPSPSPKEPIARILARAEALNPLPHQSGRRGVLGLGAGRRSGPLSGNRAKRERARRGEMFGIKDTKG